MRGKHGNKNRGRKGKAIWRKQAKRERKRLNLGLGPPIGDIKDWI